MDHLVWLRSIPCTCTAEILVATSVVLLVDVILVGAIETTNVLLVTRRFDMN